MVNLILNRAPQVWFVAELGTRVAEYAVGREKIGEDARDFAAVFLSEVVRLTPHKIKTLEGPRACCGKEDFSSAAGVTMGTAWKDDFVKLVIEILEANRVEAQDLFVRPGHTHSSLWLRGDGEEIGRRGWH